MTQYSDQQKLQALNLLREKPLARVARELGIARRTLQRWRDDAGLPKGDLAPGLAALQAKKPEAPKAPQAVPSPVTESAAPTAPQATPETNETPAATGDEARFRAIIQAHATSPLKQGALKAQQQKQEQARQSMRERLGAAAANAEWRSWLGALPWLAAGAAVVAAAALVSRFRKTKAPAELNDQPEQPAESETPPTVQEGFYLD